MKSAYLFFVSIILMVAITASADDYFDQITVFSDGKITRFTQMPIKVYITPLQGTEAYLADVRYAMQEWQAASDGKIQFQEQAELSDDVDIRVSWRREGLTQVTDTKLGKTELIRLSATDLEVKIILSLREQGVAGTLSHEKMRTACLHEFGHALGLWGHSADSNDVLFFAATAQHPTAQDRATLLRVYGSPVNMDQHDIAIGVLKKQLDANPKHPRTHYLLGAVYFDQEDMEAAIASFKTCLELDGAGVKSLHQQAREKLLQAYQQSGQGVEALNLLENTLDSEASAEGYNTVGVMYYKNQEVDKAIEAFKKAIQINPRYQPAKNNLYHLYLDQGTNALKAETYTQAVAYFSLSMELNATDPTLYSLMGEAYAKSGDFSTAIGHYRKALQLNPGDAEAIKNLAWGYNNLGVELSRGQRWQEAINSYHQALQLMPDSDIRVNLVGAYWKRANAYRETGNVNNAIEAYDKLLEFDSDSVDAHSLLGDLYLKKGEYPQAINEFHAALESAPDDTQVRRNLVAVYHQYGQILERQKRYREAIDQLQRGLVLEPEHINLRLSLAYVHQNTNNFDAAKIAFEKILEIDADNSQAKKELINLHIRSGNYLLNRKQYTAALKEFEGITKSARNAGIYNTIGYLYLMKKQPLKALPAFDAALADQAMDDVAYQNLLSIESQFDRQFDKINDSEAKRIKDSESVGVEQSEVADTGIEDSDEMRAIKSKLVRVRSSLVNCLIGRKEHLKAKAKYRAALELAPTDSETKAILIDTGIFLAQEFQKKKWPKNMKEVIGWIQEHDPENPMARKLLEEAER